MNIVDERDLGDTSRIEITVKKNDLFADTSSKVDPDTMKISIYKPDGSKDVDSVSMTKNAVGEYYYYYDTSQTNSVGDYEVEIVAERGGHKEILDDKYLRLR